MANTKKNHRSPVTWFGGKGMMTAKLLPLLPPHDQYVEVFGGGASLLFAKDPAKVEIYNDLDAGLVNFFTVLRDPDLFGMFYHYVVMTPYSRLDYETCLRTWRAEEDPVMKAYKWFVVNRMSFSGQFGASWGMSLTDTARGMAGSCSRWLSIMRLLPVVHHRFMGVQVEHRSWEKVLGQYNLETMLAYVDPPYVKETRRSGGYQHELTTEDHGRLVDTLLEYPGMVMLSGYNHEVYAPLEEAGWKRTDWQTACMAAGRTRASGLQGKGTLKKKQARVESLWRNPACLKACRSRVRKHELN